MDLCWQSDVSAFELWRWRRLLRVPWTARRSNQSILKEISPGCSLEGLMLKLKFQYFGSLNWRVDSLEKTLMLGKIEGRRRRKRQRIRWLDGITNSMDMGLVDSRSCWWTGRPGVLRFMVSQKSRTRLRTERNWTVPAALNKGSNFPMFSTTLVIICLFHYTFLVGVKWYLIGVFIYISQIINEVEHRFMCLLTILICSFEIRLFRVLTHF